MPQLDSLSALFQAPPDELVRRLLYGLLVSFIVGQLNAWCYMWTHRGLSYTRTFTQALILITMIADLSMSMVAMNVIAAFGLLGGLAIIRFRTVVRDTRDTAYVLLCLVCGMACGFGWYTIAVIGSAAANLVSLYLHRTGFGAWRSLESLLRLQVERGAINSALWNEIFHRFCRAYAMVSLDDLGPTREGDPQVCQCSFKLQLRDPERAGELAMALKSAFQVTAVHLLVQQENEEVS